MLHKKEPAGSSIPRAFIWRSQGRVSIDYSSSFQVCLLRVMVSTNWSTPGQGALGNAASPAVSHGVTQSDFAASLVLKLKHS